MSAFIFYYVNKINTLESKISQQSQYINSLKIDVVYLFECNNETQKILGKTIDCVSNCVRIITKDLK